MKIIGLTGGVASGKNFVADIFAKKGAVIFDADKESHLILENDQEAILLIKNFFPESFLDGKIDRKILGKIVFENKEKLKILEEIIHPKIRKKYQEFLTKFQEENKKIAILNIPLLLESQGYNPDFIIAIIADLKIRKERFIKRELIKNSNQNILDLEKKFDKIVANQSLDVQRLEIADFVINSELDKNKIESEIDNILKVVF